jgi:hypothetical protein
MSLHLQIERDLGASDGGICLWIECLGAEVGGGAGAGVAPAGRPDRHHLPWEVEGGEGGEGVEGVEGGERVK